MVSEFEKQRQLNIERNRKLLSSLNLDTLNGQITQSIKKEEANSTVSNGKTRSGSKRKVEKTPLLPTRRSRRIAGVVIKDENQLDKFELDQDRIKREREELEKLKNIRVDGDLNLIDLIKDKDDEDLDDSKLALKFQSFINNTKKFSIGDYYETITKKDNSSSDVRQIREEFSSKELYPHFKPNEIKLTRERMTYITFHPSIDKKLIIGGDTNGNTGIWDSSNVDQVDITNFKIHSKSIAKFDIDVEKPNLIYTASYDGSVRSIDLSKLQTQQILTSVDDAGISDINLHNHNEIYYTTLDGEFNRFDLRSSKKSTNNDLIRLSNKKIGGFAINPKDGNLIATASLDRTLKIWDIRYIVDSDDWNEVDQLQTFNLQSTYSSRLSVSIVDWNHSNDIVCNGYDDSINIFNLDKKFQKDLVPNHKIKHNCQTGRWVSILKSRWQKFPNDKYEKFVIANMNKYFDVYDRNGVQLAHLSNPLMTNVPAVSNFHQTENWIVGGGASGKVYLFY